MGDPNGIGPELILKGVAEGGIVEDFLVIGDFDVLDYANELLRFGLPLRRMAAVSDWEPGVINLIDLHLMSRDELSIGRISKQAGFASRNYVEQATALALEHSIDAIVTLPVNKEAVRLSDPRFTGHTEFIAQLCGASDTAMMLVSERLIVTHATTHLALADAIKSLSVERILKVIHLTHHTLARLIEQPRLAVAGLNPHAGEGGAFGQEELQIIGPAIRQAEQAGIQVEGPIAPDTVFLKASRGGYDAVVCMYHDQGHIPLKMIDFEGGVNVTLGLDIIRTSVDHGTAYDIAYQGKASARSLVEAVKFARKLIK